MQADCDQVLQQEGLPPSAFSFSFFAVSKQETSKQGDKEVNSWVCLWGGESDVKGSPSASNWKGKREDSCLHQLSFELKLKKRGAWIHNKPMSKLAFTHYSS